ANSAEYLLPLCDRFQMVSIVERIEEFLISVHTGNVSIEEKLSIADQYKLFGLQEHCLSSLKSKEDFYEIKDSSIFIDFTDEMKFALFERLFEVSR
ncbi:hypothetical protein PMAYCL1PPCAC_24948, partial [Pristionchus mayeri]